MEGGKYMNIDLSEKEMLYLYGQIKHSYLTLNSTKSIKTSKSEYKFYENLLAKMESAYPALKLLPIQ